MATPRKTPQDHKKPQAQVQEEVREALADLPPLAETPGHELLRPLADVDGFEQMDLLTEFEEAETEMQGFKAAARRIRDEFVIDAEGFEAFNSGPGAAGRLMKLVMAYVGEMGKGVL